MDSAIAGGWGTRSGPAGIVWGWGACWGSWGRCGSWDRGACGVSALVSTLYKGAGVPFFFIMGWAEG